MGFFSYRCAKSNRSIPAPDIGFEPGDSEIVLVLPNNKVLEGSYDGYGKIGQYEILEEVAKCLKKNAPEEFDYLTDFVFSSQKSFVNEGKEITIDKFNWSEKIQEGDILKTNVAQEDFVGKTMNQLTEEGFEYSNNFSLTEDNVKIVLTSQYEGEKFEELKTSPRCEYQGYFYPEDFDITRD